MEPRRVVIMGAAGRDFHDFNVVFRDDPGSRVVAFTATQIPGIAGRSYPPELAGALYPDGIPIRPEDELEQVIREERADLVVFAYSDVRHEDVMHAASRAQACGTDFLLLGPGRTELPSTRPVLAVCATRTGAGKSQTSRYLAAILERAGQRVVVVRHPMPYGDLAAQRVQRFATMEDLDRHRTTIEEREEYEPHLAADRIVYAGVDYAAILAEAEQEADVILWDGGNNDFPFYRPDLLVVVADPLRPGDELRYHPGETNLRMADIVVINKIDSADRAGLEQVRASIVAVNPDATVVETRSEIGVDRDIEGKRVVVVEDGPSLTHGGLRYGAGIVAARRNQVKAVVKPHAYAVGSIRDVLLRYPDLEPLVPAMGYGAEQTRELEETLNAVPADLVLAATPIDLRRIVKLQKPIVRVRYELEEAFGPPLEKLLEPIVEAARARPRQEQGPR